MVWVFGQFRAKHFTKECITHILSSCGVYQHTQRNNPVRVRDCVREFVWTRANWATVILTHTSSHHTVTLVPPCETRRSRKIVFLDVASAFWSHARETGCTICAVPSLACDEISGVKMTRLVCIYRAGFYGPVKTFWECLFSINPELIYLNGK